MIASDGSGAGFPEIPQGSPGGIGAAGRTLGHAGDHLERVVTDLQGAGGALEADWRGYAARHYHVQSNQLVTLARTGAETFRSCACAVDAYAGLLEGVQDRLRHLRHQWEQAKIREADATSRLAGLAGALAGAKGHEAERLNAEIRGVGHEQSTAAGDADHAVRLARQALEHFHAESQSHAAALRGERLESAPHLGPGDAAFGGPAIGPSALAGVATPGFGIPSGGLGGLYGTLATGEPWHTKFPGYTVFYDSTHSSAEPTDDLTTAVGFVAGGVGAVGVKTLGMAAKEVVTGAAERLGIGAAGREAVERAGQAGFDETYQEGKAAGVGQSARLNAAQQARDDAIGKELAAISARRGGYAKILTQVLRRTGALRLPGGMDEVDDLVGRLVEHSSAYRAYVRMQLTSARDRFARIPTPGAQAAARSLTRLLVRSGR